jgi:hypothetical protein
LMLVEGDADDQAAFEAMSHASHELAQAESELSDLRRSGFRAGSGGKGIRLLLGFIVGFSAAWASHSEAESFREAAFVKIAAGVATFAALPYLFAFSRARRTLFLVMVLVAVIGLVSLALFTEGIVRLFAVEAAAELLFIAALDLVVERVLKQIDEQRTRAIGGIRAVKTRIASLEALIKGEEADLDWKYAVSDRFGIPRPGKLLGNAFESNND